MPAMPTTPVHNPDRLFIGGEWVRPSSDATFDVIDATTERPFLGIAEAKEADMRRAIGAAKAAFDDGPWRRMRHAERAEYLRAIAQGCRDRAEDIAQVYPRQSGILYSHARGTGASTAKRFEFYADLAETYAFEATVQPAAGDFGLLVREPVGVVGAIIPWNSPLGLIVVKVAPALLAGCTVVLKLAPEAPGEGYVLAEIAEAAGLPPGVLNVVTADREVSELLVRDPRVDKISFTGSTAAGRRIASLCGERIARCTLELGGKSAAIVLDDMELDVAATTLAAAECRLTGQQCSSLTRVVVSRSRHDELVDALTSRFAQVRVGDPFEADSQMGPLAMQRQRDKVESYIARGLTEGATLATGGGRPKDLDRGWYVEPTIFANVDQSATIAQEEIFGPVLSVIPADDERQAIDIANDTIYGLNASVFTNDTGKALAVARELRTGTVGHNAYRHDYTVAAGGFKQSGIGREGGVEGLLPYLETKLVVLEGRLDADGS
jgi:aldehyde dehydrogenase (NAD+)